MKSYGLNELRKKYLEFFESKGHLALPSFSLVPENDKSLLLINAGMAPLKPYFTGQEIPPRTRVTTCQKCIRTGDIENVGKTARHGTFFEMLGNFSFGDYFKHEAIAWSWEFLTKVLGIPEDRLYPSVYLEDDEAFDIWNKEIGVAKDRIFRFGKEDNFWEHGAGPCGPCSEIYYDRGEKYGCGKPGCTVGCECDRYIEIWNNVFTQFENDTNAVVKKLAKQNIKANHRTALSIMSAILIAATFMCTLCSLVQSYWNQRVQQEIFDSGNWDAQILEVQANQIELIKKNENIKDVMVKGNNQTFLLSFRENDPYLLVQNCDAKYWESMHEKNLIIRGRVPEAPGEIVVGKKFFEDNPSFKIGDTVDLELGERRKDNRIVDFLSPLQDGEVFVKTDNVQYTIVGEIDRTVSSAYNGYPAYGWLNLEETPKDTSVVVYTQTRK